MAQTFYDRFRSILAQAQVDFVGGDIRALLTTSSYTPNPAHQFVADLSGELVAANYVRKVLASKAVTIDAINHRAVFSAAAVVWSTLGVSNPARVVLYKQVTSDSDSPVILCDDLISPPAANGGDYTVTWDPTGIIKF